MTRDHVCADCRKPSYGPRCRRCTNLRIAAERRGTKRQHRRTRPIVQPRHERHTLAKQHRVITPDVQGPAWWVGLSREEQSKRIKEREWQREQQMGTNYATPEYP